MNKPKYLLVGGLVAMGFDRSGQFLFTVTHSGRGVFSVGDWQRVARDHALAYPVDYGVRPRNEKMNAEDDLCCLLVSRSDPVVPNHWRRCSHALSSRKESRLGFPKMGVHEAKPRKRIVQQSLGCDFGSRAERGTLIASRLTLE